MENFKLMRINKREQEAVWDNSLSSRQKITQWARQVFETILLTFWNWLVVCAQVMPPPLVKAIREQRGIILISQN
jgi:hypothetical protein